MAGDMGGPPLTGYTCTHMHPTCVPPRRARPMYKRTRRALIIHSAFCTLLPCLACSALPSLALVCCTPHGIASPLSTVERVQRSGYIRHSARVLLYGQQAS